MPVEATEAFWVTAGQAGAVMGGMLAATITGAYIVGKGLDRLDDQVRAIDPAALQASQQASQPGRRTRLKPEDVLGKPDSK